MPAPALSAHRETPDPIAWDEAPLRRYASSGPSCVFPDTRVFRDDFGEAEMQAALARSNAAASPLSLYVHIPFCRKACHFCTRHRIITKATRLAEPYISRLDREMVLARQHLDTRRDVTQLHWSGGTPTFLSLDQMSDLIDRLDARFGLSGSRERDYAIDIDPREADVFTLRHLQALGFNRLSLGVQDLDLKVQRAVNRVQPRVLTEALIDEADRLGFRSLSLDLIYGLPCQTRDSFADTLEQIIAMAPARLSLLPYTHLPERFAPQRGIRAEDLPGPEETLAILRIALTLLSEAGYVHIGMDRFARPDDSLAVAQRQGRLTRTFHDYTNQPHGDLLGLGVSAMSRIDDVYAQNADQPRDYEAALDAGRLPTARGSRLSFDDRVRHHAIERLICDMSLDLGALGERFGIDAPRYLADTLLRLEHHERSGLIERRDNRLSVTAMGRLLVHHLAMAFYPRPEEQPGAGPARII